VIAGAFLAATLLAAALQDGNAPVEPFRIADNLYYVGSSDIGAYLITTPAGHILIDAGYASTAPLIEASIAKAGFKVGDVKILLNTQGHADHAGGFAAQTGAEGGDPIPLDGHVGGNARRAAAIDHGAALDEERPGHRSTPCRADCRRRTSFSVVASPRRTPTYASD